MVDVSYKRFEDTLASLGFVFRGISERNKVYCHESTGALVVFPDFPPEQVVLPRHLLAARSVLQAYGIADPNDFAAKLQMAS